MKSAQATVLERAEAFRRRDFAAVYGSYHADAPFRKFFGQSSEYEVFARQQLVDDVRLTACTIIRESREALRSLLLVRHEYHYAGLPVSQIEIIECRPGAEGWLIYATLKLDSQRLPESLDGLVWADLLAAGDGYWI